MIQTVLSLIQKLGTTGAGVVCIGGGLIVLLPYFGVPAYVAQGFALVGIGIGIIAFGNTYAKREAEKAVQNPQLQNASNVPVIQAQIDKIVRASNGVKKP